MPRLFLMLPTLVLMIAFDGWCRAEIVLDSTCDIVVREEGEFDTAQGILSDLLSDYLKRVLGRERLEGPGARIEFVVRSHAARWRDLPGDEIQDLRDIHSFAIEILRDPEPRIVISAPTPLAAGYGVMAFLEEHVGIHWAFPGELGLCLPEPSPIRLEEGLYRQRPFATSRAISGLVLRTSASPRMRDVRRDGVLQEQRGFFLADDYFKTLRLGGGTVTHAMNHIFPVFECQELHPEIFPKHPDGTPFVPEASERGAGDGRNAYQAWHPCYSEPKTLEIAVARGREVFERGQQFYSLGINDGRRFQCQCPSCREIGWPQSYYRFVTQVADALRDDFPLQKVGVLAYGDVGVPPRDLLLPENVLVNVAGQRKELWEDKAPSLGSYEYIYGAGYAIPNLPWEILQSNLAYYQRHNLQLYRAEMYPVWAFDAPKAYVVRKLLWNPTLDVHQLLRDFCARTYGAAGEAMFRYYLHAGSWRSDDVQPGKWTPMWNRIWPFQDTMQFQNIADDYHDRLFAALAEAGAQQLTDKQRKRLEMVEHFTRFSRNCYQMWQLKEAVFAGAVEPMLAQQAESLANESRELTDVFAEHFEWFLGSSVGPDSFGQREWPVTSLRTQLRTASVVVAAAGEMDLEALDAAARQRAQLIPLRREEHSWYKPWQSRRMELVGREDGGFRFESCENEVISHDEDDRHNGEQRFQWLHATARDLSPEDRYMLQADFEGAGGMLELRVRGKWRDGERHRVTLAESYLGFGSEPRKQMRRFVIDMERFDFHENDAGRSETLNVQWILLWRPDTPKATLAGTARLIELPR